MSTDKRFENNKAALGLLALAALILIIALAVIYSKNKQSQKGVDYSFMQVENESLLFTEQVISSSFLVVVDTTQEGLIVADVAIENGNITVFSFVRQWRKDKKGFVKKRTPYEISQDEIGRAIYAARSFRIP